MRIATTASPATLPPPSRDAQLVFVWELRQEADREVVLLSRHLQATAHASSVRWISAFSIGSYRQFIETFFANDKAAIDGEGRHFLESNRELLDVIGVTHLSQLLPPGSRDQMADTGFLPGTSEEVGSLTARLYSNPAAYPKAFVAANEWETPATPPRMLNGASARITRYEPTTINIAVATPQAAYLIVTDAWLPQWRATIDGESAPVETAGGVFRSLAVPAGQHDIVLSYHSPAVKSAKVLTGIGLTVVIVLLLWPRKKT
jgi:hypothetical protein